MSCGNQNATIDIDKFLTNIGLEPANINRKYKLYADSSIFDMKDVNIKRSATCLWSY